MCDRGEGDGVSDDEGNFVRFRCDNEDVVLFLEFMFF